jgi:hypothetical protein
MGRSPQGTLPKEFRLVSQISKIDFFLLPIAFYDGAEQSIGIMFCER